jgi:hypothetical protein
MKLNLTEGEKAEVLPHIRHTLASGEAWEGPSMHFPVQAIIEAILEIEGVERDKSKDEDCDYRDGFSTNGWQWDWWQLFTHKGVTFVLSGSGYYGGHRFYKEDA